MMNLSTTPEATIDRPTLAVERQSQAELLAMSMAPGIPGTVKYSSVPQVPLGQHVETHREIGNMQYGGPIEMGVVQMQITCKVLSGIGPLVAMQADNSGNTHGRGTYHLYFADSDDRDMLKQLQDAATRAGNDMKEFGKQLLQIGGAIAQVVIDAASKGAEIAVAVLAVLWALATGGEGGFAH
jgi:hypothetical protein